jgi:hypothetical protein
MLYKTKRIVKLEQSQAANRSAAFYRTRHTAERASRANGSRAAAF